jgi:Acetyltransferases, including N-acetylases of ribosomal proteins
MNGFITLKTERLIIRDHIIEDLPTHHELLSNDIAMYYLKDLKTHSVEESRDNLQDSIDEINYKNRTKYFFRIELKNTFEHIGEIGYTVKEITPVGKLVGLGYFTNSMFWNNGYVSEAVKAIFRFAFEDNDVFRISTGCIRDNIGSERVMQKCGMIKEAEYKMYTWHDGKMKDRVEYRLLKNEWLINR